MWNHWDDFDNDVEPDWTRCDELSMILCYDDKTKTIT